MERINSGRPSAMPDHVARKIAQQADQLTAIRADPAASALIREVGHSRQGDEVDEVYVALVKRFQADGLQPPFEALREIAQAITRNSAGPTGSRLAPNAGDRPFVSQCLTLDE